ncbi:MAG: hypothetical protein RLZZ491_253 [Pseudomonadota bacterium]
MTTQTLTAPLLAGRPIASLLAVVQGLAKALAFARDAQARFDAIQRLNAQSDAQLAQRGIARYGIVRQVYGDLLSR